MADELLNGGMEFDAEANANIDPNSIENNGPAYPMVQWHYGDTKAKKVGGMDYFGGWVIKDGMIDEAVLLAAGWTKTTWQHDSGTEEDCFWKPAIAVSVIAMRKRWEVNSKDGSRQVFGWGDYDKAKEAGRPSGRTHVLCLVKGLESVGPLALTLKGMAALGFEGGRNSAGALTKFAQTVIFAANKKSEVAAKAAGKSPRKWPYRAFWLPVGADKLPSGEPNFIEVGQGNDTKRVVLPVAVGLPAKAEGVDLNRFYVGGELLTVVNDLFDGAKEWMAAWESIVPGATENGVTTVTVEAAAVTDDALVGTGL